MLETIAALMAHLYSHIEKLQAVEPLALPIAPRPTSFDVLGDGCEPMTLAEMLNILHRHIVEGVNLTELLNQYNPTLNSSGKQCLNKIMDAVISCYLADLPECRQLADEYDVATLLAPTQRVALMSDNELQNNHQHSTDVAFARAACPPKILLGVGDKQPTDEEAGTLAEVLQGRNVTVTNSWLYRWEKQALARSIEYEREIKRRKVIGIIQNYQSGNSTALPVWHASRRHDELVYQHESCLFGSIVLCRNGIEALKTLESMSQSIPSYGDLSNFDPSASAVSVELLVDFLVDAGFTIEVATLTVASAVWGITNAETGDVLSVIKATRIRDGFRRVSAPLDPGSCDIAFEHERVDGDELRCAWFYLTDNWNDACGAIVQHAA
ncbi:MAG: hypothetical protein K8I27_10685 [Planctomycetes bacterium]|nr:hypothetical protein [Planctomycetota bacterium]